MKLRKPLKHNKVMSKKIVKDLVNKMWASEARKLLTGCPQDTTSLLTKLLTMTTAEQEKCKTEAARARFRLGYDALREAINYGWAFGINREQSRFTRPTKPHHSRRLYALLPLAVRAGQNIGEAQAKKITASNSRHTHSAVAAR